MSYAVKRRLTKRAPDVWESARFRSIFLASSLSCSQAESTPAHTQVTQTVGVLLNKISIVFTWLGKGPIYRLLSLVIKSAKVFLVDTIYLGDDCVYLIL